ncbi:MAG: sulfate/molybdate ABC transporter ATP-binding protein [Thermodesulfobacteriota bacterium]
MSLEFSFKKELESFTLDVALTLASELLVLFGPSGAGKTMILKMISGLVTPDAGHVAIGGETVFDSSSGVNVPIRKRGTGFLFQDYALFPHMTVFENISFGLGGLTGGEVERKVAELVEVTRLRGLEGRYPHELSGGQKQRTALARTLATGPRILLLDEPFSALDYQVREKLRADLARIHSIFPITTVLVTHDLEEAFMLAARVAVINDGTVEQTGSREDVFYRPATRNVARFMGVRNIFSGRVARVSGTEVTIACPHLGEIKAHPPGPGALAPGAVVSFCIRPEEIPVIRPDKVLDNRVRENIIDCEITSTVGRGSTHVLYLRALTVRDAAPGGGGGGDGEEGDEAARIKVELPNFVIRKLALVAGKRIRVSLKKESIWIIPGP